MAKKQDADPKKIYTIRFPGEAEAIIIAMTVDTSKEKFKGIRFLTPPDRDHMIRGKVKRFTKNGFVFTSTGYCPGDWEFTELTYEILKAGFYKHIYGGEHLLKLVHNTQELQDYYNENFPDYV